MLILGGMKILLLKAFWISLILNSFQSIAQSNSRYLIGYGKSDITYIEDSLGLFGYGNYHQRINENDGATSRIYSRVVSIKDPISQKEIIYLHADLGGIFHPLRTGLLSKIKENLYPDFDESYLMMTASHTHCAPSGLSHYALYMSSMPGYKPQLVDFIVEKMYESVLQAIQSQVPSTIALKEGFFKPETPVAFNRALKSFNKNQEVERKYKRSETNLALNRNMPLLNFVDENGKSRGFINWFGVHPIELLDDHNFIDGASKGYAAIYAEEAMGTNDLAIFAQSAAGDVMTSDYHNAKSFDLKMQHLLEDSSYSHKVSSLKQARWNGKTQADKALEIMNSPSGQSIQGPLDAELIYLDMASLEVEEQYAYGHKNARTSSPILGAPFFTGSFYWKDKSIRRRMLNSFANISKIIFRIRSPFLRKDKRKYKKQLYRSQTPKKIVLNGEEKSAVGMKLAHYHRKGFSRFFIKLFSSQDPTVMEVIRELELNALEEHTLLPQILPIQILRIGNIAIAGIPTEITTIAHNRLRSTLLSILKTGGITDVFISSYANEYAGYTTTYEEYIAQRYEGGHTLYGKHQLGAFQTEFGKLAKELLKPKEERNLNRTLQPPVFSEEELKKRSNLIPLGN